MSIDLFNVSFYRTANTDLASAGVITDTQLRSHFLSSGLNEGRAFSPVVDLVAYSQSNADLTQAGLITNQQLLFHLQNFGVKEGRRFSPVVDTGFYLSNNADLSQAFAGDRELALQHLINFGLSEGRTFSPLVDINYYLSNNSDLNTAFAGNRAGALTHLVRFGVNENRKFSPFVDIGLYSALNPDVLFNANGYQAFRQLTSLGVSEGRRFSLAYDSNYYRSVNADLSSLDNNRLLQHFVQFGLREGRKSAPTFDVQFYLNSNSDLRNVGLNFQQAFQHYTNFGFKEGRSSAPPVILSGDPGNSIPNAFNLDFFRGSRSFNNFVGVTDTLDYYKFSLAVTNNVNLQLSGLSDFTNLRLIQDSNGNGIFDSSDFSVNTSSGSTASISRTLGAGTYFVLVEPFSGRNTNYNLSLSASPATVTTPRDPGQNLANALVISSGQTYTDFVGVADTLDYYKFSLAVTNNVNLQLSGLSDFTNLRLIRDSNNNGIFDSSDFRVNTSGSSTASISEILGAGTYFALVEPFSGRNTNYNLSLSASPATVTTPRDPGQDFANALVIVPGQTYTDFVGWVDELDYYRFSLANNSNVNLQLSGLSDFTNLRLIQDSNNNGIFDSPDFRVNTSGSSTASISRTLGAGTYFALVEPFSGRNTNYSLRLTTT